MLIPSGRIHQTKKGYRAGGWYLFGESLEGDISVCVETLRELAEEEGARLKLALQLAIRHGALGGKISNGYGVVTLPPEQDSLVADGLPTSITALPTPRSNELPDLRDFFFAKYEFDEPQGSPTWWQSIRGIAEAWAGQVTNGSQSLSLANAQSQLTTTFDKGILPLAPAIRDWLRYHWNNGLTDREKHFIFGEARSVCPYCYSPGHREDMKNMENRWCPSCRKSFPKDKELPTSAAKIYVSYAYRINKKRWQLRTWGWLPCNGKLTDRDGFLSQLRKVFQDRAIWSHVFPGVKIPVTEVSWLSLGCAQQNGVRWLKQLLRGEGVK